MSELQLFNFEGKDVRAIDINGVGYFIGKDVCDVLEHSNPSSAIARLDEDEKLKVDPKQYLGSNSNQELWLINESGLYSLVLTSRKPEAKKFKKWVTGEVLPSIRKTGSYNSNDNKIDKLIELMMQTNSNLTVLINNLAIKAEPKTETPKYFQPSEDNGNLDYHLYHRITIYGKKFRPDIDQTQIRERAREMGMIASRMSKERKIKIIEEENIDSRYPGKTKYYHQDILNEVFRLIF
ncbi:MAG: Bro-N domain-containing protein [Chitinophagaceae bacterium]